MYACYRREYVADPTPRRAAYATAWNSVKTGTTCSCDVDIYASADATVSGWAEIWAGIYASLDDAACAGTGAQHPHAYFIIGKCHAHYLLAPSTHVELRARALSPSRRVQVTWHRRHRHVPKSCIRPADSMHDLTKRASAYRRQAAGERGAGEGQELREHRNL